LKKKILKFQFLFFVAFFVLLFSKTCLAAPVATIVPSVIDEQGQVRDMFKREVLIKNISNTTVTLYAVVSDISEKTGLTVPIPDSVASRTVALTSWLEFFRGVIQLAPGEERKLTLSIKVPLDIEPGSYHAQIAIAPGSNRVEAEGVAKGGNVAELLVNLEIKDHVVEKLENNYFTTTKNINVGGPVKFDFRLSNIGNRSLQPRGHISIFDRNGAEVAEVPVNNEGLALNPNDKQLFSSQWQTGKQIGKFKAKMQIEYGGAVAQSLDDTIYFWLLPPWFVGLIGAIFALLILMILYLFIKINSNKKFEDVGEENIAERSSIIDLKNRNYE
jgi:hypothetical protein